MLNPQIYQTKQVLKAVRAGGDQNYLGRMLHSVNRASRAEYDRARRVEYYYCSQLINHTFGHAREALALRDQILSESGAADSAQWMTASNKLGAASALDLFDADTAEKIADEIDALVLFNGGHEVVTRAEKDVSAETWGLYVQIYLLRGERAKAAEFLQKANRALVRERELLLKITRPTKKRMLSEYLQELEAMSAIFSLLIMLDEDELTAREEIRELLARFDTDTYSQQIRSRLKVCAGAWLVGQTAPPGISFAEALRFALFAELVSREDLTDHHAALLAPPFPTEAELTEMPPDALSLANPAGPGSVCTGDQLNLRYLINELAQTVASAVRETAAPPGQTLPAAEGFSFERLDILNQLAIAQQQVPPFTGFFHLRWNTEKIRTSVLAKKISDRVLCGEAYIFMVSGFIVDATLGSYDAPVLSDEPQARRDARETMCLLLRLGLGIDLDNFADGYAVSHASASVAERAPRLRMQQIHLSALLADIETGADQMPAQSESASPLLPPAAPPQLSANSAASAANNQQTEILFAIDDFEGDEKNDDLLELCS